MKKPKVMLVVVKVVVMALVLAVFSFKLQIVVVGVVVCFMHRLLWQCRLGIRENIIYRLTQLFLEKGPFRHCYLQYAAIWYQNNSL